MFITHYVKIKMGIYYFRLGNHRASSQAFTADICSSICRKCVKYEIIKKNCTSSKNLQIHFIPTASQIQGQTIMLYTDSQTMGHAIHRQPNYGARTTLYRLLNWDINIWLSFISHNSVEALIWDPVDYIHFLCFHSW